MMHYSIAFVLLFFSSLITAQSKAFINEISYKRDHEVYIFDPIEKTSITEENKKLVKSKDKESLKKLDKLIELNKVNIVKNIFLVRDTTEKKDLDFLFNAEEEQILGPFNSKYGKYRFIKIYASSNQSKPSYEDISYACFFLSYKKGSKNQLKRFTKQFLSFYKTGKKHNYIFRRIKKFRSPDKGINDFIFLPSNRETIEELESGEHCLVLEHSEGLGVFLIQKRVKGDESVQYIEYIFR